MFIRNLTLEMVYGVTFTPRISVNFAAASAGPTPRFSVTNS